MNPFRSLLDVKGTGGRAVVAAALIAFVVVASLVLLIGLMAWHWWLGVPVWILVLSLGFRYAVSDPRADRECKYCGETVTWADSHACVRVLR